MGLDGAVSSNVKPLGHNRSAHFWHHLVSGAALIILLCGCTGPQSARETRIIALHYYPYTVSDVRTVATPVPDYQDWDNARMTRDLERLSELGIDVVMVSMNPEEVYKPERMQRYRHFVDLAKAYPVKVAFMAEAHGASEASVQAFGDWCAEQMAGREGYLHISGKPLVELYDALQAETYTHPALTTRHTVWAREWYWGTHWDHPPPLSRNGEQVMAFAGFLNNGDRPELGWEAAREQGELLRRQFRLAVQSSARFICIASYNDFWEGHFIEPNTLDGSGPFDVLQEEIKQLRANELLDTIPCSE